VASATSYLEPLKNGAIGCASRTVNSRLQMALIDQTKTVIESMQNLMVAAKEAGGNRKVGAMMFIMNSLMTR
jgi:talin